MENTLADGIYLLSGIDSFHYCHDGWSEECEGHIIILNDEPYVVAYDHTDGYRSYGEFYKATQMDIPKVKFRFPPQPVVLRNHDTKGIDELGREVDYHGTSIFDAINGKLVFEVGTDFADAYYPCATMEYHPENLTINQNR